MSVENSVENVDYSKGIWAETPEIMGFLPFGKVGSGKVFLQKERK